MVVGRDFQLDVPHRDVVEADDVSFRECKQDWRVGGDNELSSAGGHQLRHAAEQSELPLRREGRLRLVHNDYTRPYAVQEDREESFTVRLRIERAPAVSRVGIAKEVRIFVPLVQERREVGLEFRSEEIAILGTPAEGRTKGGTKRAVLLGTMSGGGLVASAARDRQAARLGYGFDECRLARAILPDQVRDGPLEGQVRGPNERGIVRNPLRGPYALRNNVKALEEGRVLHVTHRRSETS